MYGVDLSEQSVEITQLALWLRSAKNDRKLADLSHNIVRGNSLVTDPAVHDQAMRWAETFPKVFDEEPRADGEEPVGGFDAVIGNPPWERMKLQEREFFAHSAPAIAGAVNAADRRKSIRELETKNPELFERYVRALRNADSTLAHVRGSGEFPLTAKGDINTYMLFAELARKIVAPYGRVGLLVPSGIATDNTTREFFADLIDSKSLISLFDFENKAPIFPDVHRSYKFCILLVGGEKRKTPSVDFVFFAHHIEEIGIKKRHIVLSTKDIALLNPNTKTCPIFRTRRDADITKDIYRRIPILIDHNREEGGNPWEIKFSTMFHQTNDAELFFLPEQLMEMGFKLQGNSWLKGKQVYLPLYEAKMFRPYDHRHGSVFIDKANWLNQGQTEETSIVQHNNSEHVVQPRWWAATTVIAQALNDQLPISILAFRNITRPTDNRTMIAAFIPTCGVINSAPIILFAPFIGYRLQCCLLGNLNSVPLDYVVRNKMGGVNLNFFIVEQLPIFPPDRYEKLCPWDKSQTLEKWISDRVLKLTCTANDMKPLAKAAGFNPPVYKWDVEEREKLKAELDAAYFRLYGISRDDAEYILGTFQGLKDDAARQTLLSSQSQTQAILTAYDALKPVK